MAEIISEAFEQNAIHQQELLVQNKHETLAEVKNQDLATKRDIAVLKGDIAVLKEDIHRKIAELKLENHKEISTAKWQVIGSIAALLFIQIILKHFGF